MFQALNAARRSATASHPSFLTTPMHPYQLDNHTIALTKPPLLTVLTNYGSGTPAIGIYLSPRQTAYKSLLPIIDILSNQIYSTDPRGGITIPLVAGEPRVFLPLSVHRGVASEETWSGEVKVKDEVKVASSSSPSPAAHRKRPSFGAMISRWGVGRDSKEL